MSKLRKLGIGTAALSVALFGIPAMISTVGTTAAGANPPSLAAGATTTPIKHVVVIFQENVSFDHYFGTYPNADEHVRASRSSAHGGRHGQRPGRHAGPRRQGHAADQQPQPRRGGQPGRTRGASTPPTSTTSSPATRTTTTTTSRRRSTAARWTSSSRRSAPRAATSATGQACSAGDVMNYYDGNTVTGAVELRAALRDERQLVRHHIRPLRARARSTSSRATPAASVSTINGADTDGDTVARRPGRHLAGLRRPAVLRRLLDARRGVADRHQHRRRAERRRPQLGLVPGRLPADDELRHGRRAGRSRRARSSPTSSRASSRPRRPPTRACATRCTRSAPRSAAPVARRPGRRTTATRTTTSPTTSRSSTTPRPRTRTTCRRLRWRAIGTDTQTIVGGVPQFDTANHQYDTSDFDSLVGAIAPRLPLARPPPGGQLPQGARLRGRARRLLGPVRRAAVHHRRRSTRCEHTPDWSSTAVIISYDDSDG